MSSPAERYAASRRRQADRQSSLERFRSYYGFDLDDFQVQACSALEQGRGVLVAAPTGSGKTVVGEFAVHLALEEGRKCFYTTPIKALSNQKYHDLVARHGSEQVGLLTGDNTINGEAPVVVMTTEVLRNMIYASSPTLLGLGYVVMDEVHYLADVFRGAVWEEVIVNLPDSVSIVSLSATVSNAEEFGEWLSTVRGDTDVVVEERRPVPLLQHVMVGPRLLDLFSQTGSGQEARRSVNPHLLRYTRGEPNRRNGRGPRGRGRDGRGRGSATYTPRRTEVLEKLDSADLLPAIVFVFSRAGCDAAVEQCLASGVRLTERDERDEIRAVVEERVAGIPDDDLRVLGYDGWLDGLQRGIAAHHAGMLPTFKEVVEELFVRGLLRAVFATETLALGINMPARTVVLERLVKWNGETHADITPGEYTQLTGRAGRRGIDLEGHAVVLWQPGFDPSAVAGLASTRTYPLRSSFRPSYNMAVNLVGHVGRDTAREILESSFAQFQSDRAVVGMAQRLKRSQEALEGYREAMTCELGDFEEYAELRQAIKDREKALEREGTARRRAEAAASLEKLRTGDVIQVPAGKSAGLAVVLDPGRPGGNEHRDGPRPTVLTEGRQVRRLSLTDFPDPVESVARMRIPKSFNPKVPAARRELAANLRAQAPQHAGKPRRRKKRSMAIDDEELTRLRREMRQHPCHRCPEREEHARWAQRWFKLRREAEQLTRRIDSRTNILARQFDRVCTVLESLDYLHGDETTESGRRLARLYGELDLVAAECLRHGVWEGLDPAELAACVSALTFESRQPDDSMRPSMPPGQVREVLTRMVQIWTELDELESSHGVDLLREPDLGFAHAAWRWASGHRLEAVLQEAGLAAGDFVRAVRQLLDLLDQIGDAAAGTPLRDTARHASASLRRGIVAYDMLT
ncbi:DEAD/DEAH box helicase [Actinobacteria bacterium YIM 96077]|uniref:Probable helicase HelY n=1 Tax=Phytoactinopolyspora halophila TaxID=1981511 RepID=A0A329QZA8_9ACTN|nr:DEAD/DEAH box helicase [Phytoactinopolyspora halophila]AYY13302.1 DEAD/DEAH box helicase [Actinobacteria bacterium YIM 96077]RAW17463.1 RNA helicase [Phytoactinopolyspora halophila]